MCLSCTGKRLISVLVCGWSVFQNLVTFVFTLKGYNDYVAKKIKKPRLSAEGLKIHIDALSDLLSLP